LSPIKLKVIIFPGESNNEVSSCAFHYFSASSIIILDLQSVDGIHSKKSKL